MNRSLLFGNSQPPLILTKEEEVRIEHTLELIVLVHNSLRVDLDHVSEFSILVKSQGCQT